MKIISNDLSCKIEIQTFQMISIKMCYHLPSLFSWYWEAPPVEEISTSEIEFRKVIGEESGEVKQ